MTKKEVSERFQIPLALLEDYERWNLCNGVKQVIAVRQYDDRDLERLSMIVTLYDSGFSTEEIERYMRLYLSAADTRRERLAMLDRKRSRLLDELHLKQMQLDRLDYLRHKIRKMDEGKD